LGVGRVAEHRSEETGKRQHGQPRLASENKAFTPEHANTLGFAHFGLRSLQSSSLA
jgi:hypothetical protein